MFRQIHTSIWKKPWVLDLEPDEKLLFIYLFSNEQTNLTGLYELPIRVMEFETGIPKARITEILAKFDNLGKVRYDTALCLVWVVNLTEYNAGNVTSPTIQPHIRKSFADTPDCDIKTLAIGHYNGMVAQEYRMDTVSIPPTESPDTVSIPIHKQSKAEGQREREGQGKQTETEKATATDTDAVLAVVVSALAGLLPESTVREELSIWPYPEHAAALRRKAEHDPKIKNKAGFVRNELRKGWQPPADAYQLPDPPEPGDEPPPEPDVGDAVPFWPESMLGRMDPATFNHHFKDSRARFVDGKIIISLAASSLQMVERRLRPTVEQVLAEYGKAVVMEAVT